MPFHQCPLGCGRFLSSVDSHNRCLQCLGIQHAEAAFVDGSCLYCERMTIATLRSRLTFLKGKGADPSATTSPGFSELRGHSPGGDFALQATKVTAWSLGKNNSGSTWSRWEMLTKCAFLTLPSPRLACRGLHPAVLGSTEADWSCSFSGGGGDSTAPYPGTGPGGKSFVSAQRPVVTTFSTKEHFPFPLGYPARGLTVSDALPPHSRPRFPLLPVAKRLRFGDALPLHASLASPSRDKGSSVVMSQNTLPSGPSSMTPHCCTSVGMLIVPLVPLAQSLGAWLELPNPSRWLIRTVRVGYVIQFARRLPRFSSVPKICDNPRHHCSVRGYCCPVGEGCNQACPSSWDEAGVLQPLLHCAK